MGEDKTEEPLVTVGILSYNSAKTILETLESVKAQTYKNLELIISDDASKDDTVEVCRKWIEENKDRFVRCEILTVPENTGIPANANRRLAASKGVWSKGVAADDLLLPDCVENFVNYVKENPQAEIVFAKMQIFKENFAPENFVGTMDSRAKEFCEKYDTPQKQHAKLLKGMYCSAPTMFARLSTLQKIKYDEEFKTIEDYPMWLRLTKAGKRFYFLDKDVAMYRSHESISYSIKSPSTNILFKISIIPFKRKYIYPNLSIPKKIGFNIRCFKLKAFKRLGLLNDTPFSNKLLFFLNFLKEITSKRFWIQKIKNIPPKK